MTLRAATYSRKSTEQSVADEARSVTRQAEQARAFAEKNGWTVADEHVYVDDAISGARFDRPGLRAMLAAVAMKPRPFDILITMSVDRLGREMSETMKLQLQIVRSGVRLFFYQSGAELVLATATDKLKSTIDLFGAESYREDVTKKVRDAMRRLAERGCSTGGHVLGYGRREVLADGKRSHVVRVVDPEQAEIVRRIFQMAADGLGYMKIAKRLNGDGVRNPTGRLSYGARTRKPSTLWSPTGVRHVLKRKLYVGIMEYCQSRFAEPTRDEDGRERKLKVVRPPSEWVTVAVPDCRIVSDALWQAAQDRLDRTRQSYIRRRDGRLLGKPESGLASTHLLAGFVKCATCGGNLIRVLRDKRAIYVCSEHHRRGTAGCAGKYTVGADTLTADVVGRLRARLANPAAMAGMLAEVETLYAPPGDLAEQVRELTDRIGQLDGELERLAEAVATGGAIPALLARLKDTQRRRDEAADTLAHLEATERGPGFDREDWRAFLGQLVAGLDVVFQIEPQAGRQVLRRLLGNTSIVVTITADGYTFQGLADYGAASSLLTAIPFTTAPAAWRL
ncbi:MAG: recombinase family protein [Candidatus Rokuibacteriota bacterium]